MGSISTADVKYSSDEESTLRLMSSTSTVFRAAFCLVAAVLIIHSQIYAYVGDETFHLLAAKLISSGRKPYADFFYQHPPLFVYLVAGLFRIVGAGWRAVHLLSAFAVIGAIALAAAYARDLFREESTRWLNAALMPLLIGLNCYVLVFATTGLPFGFCLLFLCAALSLSRMRTRSGLFFTGLFAGAAAASSFLTAPALIVLLFWLARREKANSLWFVGGATVAFIPLLIFLITSPDTTFQDVFRYHFVDRRSLGWRFNLREIAGFVVTLQGLTLILPAIAGVWFRKDEDVRLCAWIAIALMVPIAVARTTFSFYFLVATPFLAILAAAGLNEIAKRSTQYSKLMIPLAASIYLVGLFGLKHVWRWEAPYWNHHLVTVAKNDIERCAPSGNFFAPEAVYFEARHLPPPGMENRFDPHFPADKLLREGRFDGVLIEATDPRIKGFELSRYYGKPEVSDFGASGMLVFCQHRP
jgi:hypothetical protein